MLRVAILGAGRWGPNLIRTFQNHPASEVAWVIDPNEGRLSEVAARFPHISISQNAEAAIADAAVDAVVVSTPPVTHCSLVRSALLAGKHVLVEKPFTTTVREAEELCLLAESLSLKLMVGHIFVFNPAVQEARKYITQGHLGRIYYLSMIRTNLGDIRPDVNCLWDLAPHDISIANFWLGSHARSATAVGGSWINRGREDAVFGNIKYADDVLVNINVSWLNPRKVRHITVVGEKKMLTFDDMDLNEPIRIYDKGVGLELREAPYVDTFASFRSSIREGEIVIPRVNLGEPLRAECDHFVECVLADKEPLTNGRGGLEVVKTLRAIQRSLEAGGIEQMI